MTKVTQLRPGLWQISLPFQEEEEIIGSYLLAGNDELVVIDPGPGSTIGALLEGIHEAGFDPQDLTHILITHVHLDHAGATGS
ncbi:MAG TPA: MBL fold metallo-hydrolase, partial [Ktedonobacteraceae bacterium]|nr:MBL fold metallo-hydrolase [Ktedonobacteraceae bacterium]